MHKLLITILLTLLLAACSGEDGGATAQGSAGSGPAAMAGHQMPATAQPVAFKTPQVPFKYGLGMRKFRDMCAKCHGEWGQGTDQGPPLMHPFYKPSHHADTAFYRAALEGVKAHHWKFGNMPPVEGATARDVSKILPFLRWLQQENGIY